MKLTRFDPDINSLYDFIQAHKGLGANQTRALSFIRRVNGWHTYAPDVSRAVESLAARGLVEVNFNFTMFRAVLYIPYWARALTENDRRYSASKNMSVSDGGNGLSQFFPTS